MLLVIHNLPLNTRFGDVKSLLLEKCGLRNLILDKLIYEDNAMKITVGLPTEEDAALLVRKINGLYLKGHQLYVQDLRQKPSEQPYRLPKPSTRQDDNQQNWNSNQHQGWNNTPQQSWNNTPQQNWNNNQQQSWNNSPLQNWKNPMQNRNNESERNPFLYQQQNQNVQGGYGQELATAAAMWAQQAQQVNAVYDNQSVHYPQCPQQFGQVDNQGYGGWGQGSQSHGFEQDRGQYANTNTLFGESSVPAQPRGLSQETSMFNDLRHAQPDRSFEQDSRDRSRQYSEPREKSFERPQGRKRRWEENEPRRDDGWRQRPASPPREFRQHHRGRDKGAPPQRSGFNSRPEPWTDASNQTFQPSNPRFETPKPKFENSKPRFEAPKPKFEPKLKFNKKQKFNTPNQNINVFKPKFNPRNPGPNAPNASRFDNKNKLETIPWDKLTEKLQQKIIKRNDYNRNNTVNRIIFDIFNDLGLSQDDNNLKRYFTDPVRSRLNKVLGDERFIRRDMMYAKYLDAYNDEKQKILEEARQLQRDGVEPKLLFIKPGLVKHSLSNESRDTSTSHEPQVKRFKAEGVGTGPSPGPSKPVPCKIPSYIDGDKQRFKAIKQQHLKDMETLRCPDVGPKVDKIVDVEVDAIADIFYKVIENTPDKKQKTFLQGRANKECIDDFKKMFKQKICQRLTNEGAKIVRIYAFTGKPPKKVELEPFMKQFGALALKKSARKPFFTAHLDSYKTLDKLCNMGNVRIGNSDVIFKPLHMTPKYKRIHTSSLNKLREKYVASQIKKPEVNILEKDWEIKLAAIKEKEEILKQEKAAHDAVKQEILKQDDAAQDASKKETDVKAENSDVKTENSDVKSENDNVKLENDNVNSENNKVKSENDNIELGNGNAKPENLNTDVHTDKYGELHSNFDIIDEVQGSDTENDAFNSTTEEVNDEKILAKSDESILRELPVGINLELIFDDDDSGGGDEEQVFNEEDIDLDDIDEDDLEDY